MSIIANYWFADNERARATSLMMISNPLGLFMSFFIQFIYSEIMQHKVKNQGYTLDEAVKEGV